MVSKKKAGWVQMRNKKQKCKSMDSRKTEEIEIEIEIAEQAGQKILRR